MTKPFASSEDNEEQRPFVDELAPGVYARTSAYDPNVGAIVGPDCVLCIDAYATPALSRPWVEELRAMTDKPIEYLVLTHYHAVRTLGASAFGARHVVAHEATRRWIAERGEQDFESELRRFPRLFRDVEEVPGLTVPDVVFEDAMTLRFGEREIQILWLGLGHTAGDAVVWLPEERILFAGDLVEAGAAPYMGDAFIEAWTTTTLDAVEALGARVIVPGRGPVAGLEAIFAARSFLRLTWQAVAPVREAGGSLAEAGDAARAALEPHFGDWPIFEHCFPFNVARAYDEAGGRPPEPWTPERDAAVWSQLQG
jgi:glyoxylase-like metal-dependent hydrolase (beta-lactamase superfamily II)